MSRIPHVIDVIIGVAAMSSAGFGRKFSILMKETIRSSEAFHFPSSTHTEFSKYKLPTTFLQKLDNRERIDSANACNPNRPWRIPTVSPYDA
jgi:hypothetical protein